MNVVCVCVFDMSLVVLMEAFKKSVCTQKHLGSAGYRNACNTEELQQLHPRPRPPARVSGPATVQTHPPRFPPFCSVLIVHPLLCKCVCSPLFL